MTSSVLLAAALLAAATTKSTDQAAVGLNNGIYVYFSVDGPPGLSSVYAYDSDTISRAFADPANCAYFGYEMVVKPADEGRIEVRLGPLGAKGEEQVRRQLQNWPNTPCRSPRAVSPVPKFPPHATLDDGEGLSIDLLANAQSGATLTDRIRVTRRSSIPYTHSDEPARDLRLEDLSFGVSPRGRLLIDGQEQPNAGAGCRGTLVYMWFPKTRERFVLSLVPRQGFDFRKVGLADQDRLTFAWDGVRYEWIGQEPVVGPGVRSPVWVLRDDGPPLAALRSRFGEMDRFFCGAGDAAHVLGRR